MCFSFFKFTSYNDAIQTYFSFAKVNFFTKKSKYFFFPGVKKNVFV